MSSRSIVLVDKNSLVSARISAGFKSQTAAADGSGVKMRTWCRAESGDGRVSRKSAELIARRVHRTVEQIAASRTQTPQDGSGRVIEAFPAYSDKRPAGGTPDDGAALREVAVNLSRTVREQAAEITRLRRQLDKGTKAG